MRMIILALLMAAVIQLIQYCTEIADASKILVFPKREDRGGGHSYFTKFPQNFVHNSKIPRMTRPEHMSKLMLRPVLASNTRFEVNSAEHGHYQLRPGGIVPGLHLGDIVDDDDVDVYVVDDDDAEHNRYQLRQGRTVPGLHLCGLALPMLL